MDFHPQGLGASEKKNKKKNTILAPVLSPHTLLIIRVKKKVWIDIAITFNISIN